MSAIRSAFRVFGFGIVQREGRIPFSIVRASFIGNCLMVYASKVCYFDETKGPKSGKVYRIASINGMVLCGRACFSRKTKAIHVARGIYGRMSRRERALASGPVSILIRNKSTMRQYAMEISSVADILVAHGQRPKTS